MTRSILIVVDGLPAAQGSKRHVGNGVMIESSKAVKPWRQDVVAAARTAISEWEGVNGLTWDPFTGAVELTVKFWMPRPKAHFRTGKNAHLLKDNAPQFVAKKPDLDKTLRSTLDALTTAAVWHDDSLAARIVAQKTFSHYGTGAWLEIKELLP